MRVISAIVIGLAALAGIAAFTIFSAPYASQFTAQAQSSPTTRLVLEVDEDALRTQQLEFVADIMSSALRSADPNIRHTGRGVVDDAARVRLVNAADADRALSAIRALAPSEGGLAFATTSGPDGLIEARLSEQQIRALVHAAATQDVEVLRRRLASFGDRVTIELTEGDRILIRAQSSVDMETVRYAAGVTGLLSFHLVREVSPAEAAAGLLPPDTVLAQPHAASGGAYAEVVERRPRFTGARLARAHPTTDPQTGEFVLSFSLDAEGRRLFCRITRDYTGQRFAVLLDGQVLTAPRINEPICGGTGQISGNFTAQSANDLAVLLRAGALPAPLKLIEEGVDGAR